MIFSCDYRFKESERKNNYPGPGKYSIHSEKEWNNRPSTKFAVEYKGSKNVPAPMITLPSGIRSTDDTRSSWVNGTITNNDLISVRKGCADLNGPAPKSYTKSYSSLEEKGAIIGTSVRFSEVNDSNSNDSYNIRWMNGTFSGPTYVFGKSDGLKVNEGQLNDVFLCDEDSFLY